MELPTFLKFNCISEEVSTLTKSPLAPQYVYVCSLAVGMIRCSQIEDFAANWPWVFCKRVIEDLIDNPYKNLEPVESE